MKVHLNQIPPEGKFYEGEDPASILDIQEPDIRPQSPVHYALDVGLSEGGIFVTGTLQVEIEFICVRCLEKFTRPVEINDFAMQEELSGPETIDLTPFLREDILLAFPAHPHCDWDGQKKCPGDFDLAEVPVDPEKEDTTPAKSAWDALENFKVENER